MSSSKVKIHQSNSLFDNDSISITRPVVVQGGTYFTKIRSCHDNTPYYVQFDPCKTKQGVVSTNKRSYIDLLYNTEDVEILEWFENLQDILITKIYEQRNEWFQSEMERTDVENNFVNLSKSYKGGKYHLIRVGMNIPNEQKNKGKACVVFDEYENVISINDIQESDCLEGILEVQGIRFTSKMFQIEMVCKQVKVCQKESTFDKCMITHDVKKKDKDNELEDIGVINVNKEESEDVVAAIDNDSEEMKNKNMITKDEQDKTINYNNTLSNVSDDLVSRVENMDVMNISVVNEIENNDIDERFSEKPESNNEQNNLVLQERYDKISHINTEQNEKKDDNKIGSVGEAVESVKEPKEEVESEDIENHVSFDGMENEHNLMDVSSSFDNDLSENGVTTSLKDPQEIYYEIYKIAKRKAREHKIKSITHYLEAKNIKNQYLLDDLDESEPDDDINDYYYDSDITNQSQSNDQIQQRESEST